MLSRAAESIGLHYRPPPSPEHSRLDDWFLGAQAERRQPPPVPFFPEVHEVVTRSWKAPFSARNRPSASSVLTTLDSGAAQGYVEVPPVERAIAMQLCPQGAAAWRGNPRLPSRACKFSSALTAKAYSAAGQAASALHAMALLQVHQAKALKQLHEGDADPGVLQELRTATDLALRATKVTARTLGQTMSTLVVQERHLWLTLVDMRESDKHRFLDSPISQADLFGEAVEDFAQQFNRICSVVRKQGYGAQSPQNFNKRAVSFSSGSQEGEDGSVRDLVSTLPSPSLFASGQQGPVRGRDAFSRIPCPTMEPGQCHTTHSDPTSRRTAFGVGPLCSISLPHRGYVSNSPGPACTVPGGLARAPQAVSLAPEDLATRFSSPGVPPSSGAFGSPQC